MSLDAGTGGRMIPPGNTIVGTASTGPFGVFVLAFDTGPKTHGAAVIYISENGALYQGSATEPSDDPTGTVDRRVGLTVPPCLVAIECPLHAFSAKTTTPIIATARAAGELGGAAMARGYRVEYITAADWRAGLLGVANAHDPAVRAWVEEHIQGWPKKSNPHTRDAAALAVFAGRRWLRAQEGKP
jgi:hypothetical protein